MQSFRVGHAPHRGRLAILSLAAALLGAACGDDDGGGGGGPAAMPPSATADAGSGGSTGAVRDASTSNQQSAQQDAGAGDAGVAPGDGGIFFAEVVTANGTGCPQGSWTGQLAADRQSFRIAFTRYEAQVGPQDSAEVKDCQLRIRLRSRAPVSYAVQSFAFDGRARLDRGVSAQLTANYYFQGDPSNDVGQQAQIDGPYDQPFSFRQSITLPEQVWSACAIERDLNLTSRVRVLNGNPRASGRVNVAESSGGPQLFVAIAQRSCR